MLFSPTTQAFYSEILEYSNLPSDTITIDEEEWDKYLAKINDGYFVYVDGGSIKSSDTKKPSIYYSYDTTSNGWVQSEKQKAEQTLLDNKSRLEKAKSLYSTTTSKLSEFGYIIDDKDYSTYTEEKLLDLKSQLTSYRVSLRSYLNTDGSEDVPYYETT